MCHRARTDGNPSVSASQVAIRKIHEEGEAASFTSDSHSPLETGVIVTAWEVEDDRA